MPDIDTKPPELLQAQLATFAAEAVPHYHDNVHIFVNIGDLALAEPGDITRVTDRVEYVTDVSEGKRVRIPEGTERMVATKDSYTEFLRSVGGSRYEAIEGRAHLLHSYEQFKPAVARLKSEISDVSQSSEHPDRLGAGTHAYVFSMNQGGKTFAVRVLGGEQANPLAVDSYLAGAVLGKGVPHLEQVVAASYIDGVTVSELMPGKEVGTLSPEEIRGVTDTQLSELVDTVISASERGIEIDPKPSNLFYDPEQGYGIIDYHSSKVVGKHSADQSLGTMIGGISTGIVNGGFYGKPHKAEKTAEDFARDLEFTQANLVVLQQLKKVVEDKLSGEDRAAALEEINDDIAGLETSVAKRLEPGWVQEQMAQQRERNRKLQEKSKEPAVNGWLHP